MQPTFWGIFDPLVLKLTVEAINGEVPGFYYGNTRISVRLNLSDNSKQGWSDLRSDLKPGLNQQLDLHFIRVIKIRAVRMFGFLKPGPNQQLDLRNHPSTNHPCICSDFRIQTPCSLDVRIIFSDQNSEQS